MVWDGNGVEERGLWGMFGAVVRRGVGCVVLSDVCGICYGCEWEGMRVVCVCVFVCLCLCLFVCVRSISQDDGL